MARSVAKCAAITGNSGFNKSLHKEIYNISIDVQGINNFNGLNFIFNGCKCSEHHNRENRESKNVKLVLVKD